MDDIVIGYRFTCPDELPTTTVTRQLIIPDDPVIIRAVDYVLSRLTLAETWIDSDTVTAIDTASLMSEFWIAYVEQ